LEAKQKEVQDKQLELQAKSEAMQELEAQMKKKNRCIDMLVVLCLFLLISLVVILLNG
jgi:lipopolysaccharide/colanic/teichoic acid biosynthesis glycosyltransferase